MDIYLGRFCMLETDGRICLAYQQNKKFVISEKFVRSDLWEVYKWSNILKLLPSFSTLFVLLKLEIVVN